MSKKKLPKKCKNAIACGDSLAEEGQEFCYSCMVLQASDGDLDAIAWLNTNKPTSQKEKEPPPPPREGSDFFEVVADYIQTRHHLWYNGIDDIYFYDVKDGLWHMGGRTLIQSELVAFRLRAMKMSGKTGSKMKFTTMLKEVLAILKGRLASRIQYAPQVDPRYIPLKNGIYDLDTKQLLDYSPKFFFTTKIPWNYNKYAKCDKFDELMLDWYSPQKVMTGWEIMALCLYRGYPIHKFFILYSSGGQGKTTFFNILEGMLGRQNVCSIAIDKLNARFVASGLMNKFANIADEAPPDRIKNTEILKQVTGWSPVESDRKNKSIVKFKNFATMIFSLNPKDRFPESDDQSDGFYRRFCMIEFKGSQAKKSPIKDLANNIISDENEMEGVLYRSILALHGLRDRDWTLTHEENIEAVREAHMSESSPVKTFVDMFCEMDPEHNTKKSDFSIAFHKYMKAVKKKPLSLKAVNGAMNQLGIVGDRVRFQNGAFETDRVWAWLELKLDSEKVNEFLNCIRDSWDNSGTEKNRVLSQELDSDSVNLSTLGTGGTTFFNFLCGNEKKEEGNSSVSFGEKSKSLVPPVPTGDKNMKSNDNCWDKTTKKPVPRDKTLIPLSEVQLLKGNLISYLEVYPNATISQALWQFPDAEKDLIEELIDEIRHHDIQAS